MKNKFEYRIEDGSLIIDNYFNNLKIGSINCGSVENILNKCKLYDGEYETLLKENEYMKHIAKDFEQLQQENKQLKDNIRQMDSSIDKLQKQLIKEKDNWNKLKEYLHNVDVAIDYSENYDGHFINYDELIDKMQELEQGSDE
jgi:predicted RNase H-like nuclease (RuvC/YqgF family)